MSVLYSWQGNAGLSIDSLFYVWLRHVTATKTRIWRRIQQDVGWMSVCSSSHKPVLVRLASGCGRYCPEDVVLRPLNSYANFIHQNSANLSLQIFATRPHILNSWGVAVIPVLHFQMRRCGLLHSLESRGRLRVDDFLLCIVFDRLCGNYWQLTVKTVVFVPVWKSRQKPGHAIKLLSLSQLVTISSPPLFARILMIIMIVVNRYRTKRYSTSFLVFLQQEFLSTWLGRQRRNGERERRAGCALAAT